MREKFLGFDIDLDETMKDGEIRIVNTSMQIELMRMMRARGWTIEMNLLPCVTPLDNPDIGSYSVTFKATIRKNGAEKDLEDWTEELSDVS